ncbi:carbohydrate sulfotransferase 1-like [Oculina patagonica]
MAPAVIRKKWFIRTIGILAVAFSTLLFTWTLTHKRVHTSGETALKSFASQRSRQQDPIVTNPAEKSFAAVLPQNVVRGNADTKSLSTLPVLQTTRLENVKQSRSSLIQGAWQADMKTSVQRLIIVGQARTGSSFLGDAFNQHPDVFYLFEPLYGVAPPKLASDPRPMKFLEGMLRCKFEFPQYIQEIENFRRFSSKALSSPPMCAEKNQTTPNQTPIQKKLKCVHLNPYNMESVCSKYSKTVLKILTARIPNFRVDSLFPLCNSSDCGIIYLVRDPRSLIFSHMKVGFAWGNQNTKDSSPQPIIRQYSQHICQQIEQNVRIFENRPGWMKSRSHMLRYEDLARNPVEILRKAYKIAGLDMRKSSLEWIKAHTGEGTSSEKEEKNHFSTKRNSKAVVDRWRVDMDPCIVNVIEESCNSVMRLLGYKPVDRSDKTQYDLDVSLSDG